MNNQGYANQDWEARCATELFEQLELCRGFELSKKRETKLLQLIRDQYGVNHEYCTMKKMKSNLWEMIKEQYPEVHRSKSGYVGIGYRGDIIADENKKRK